jgi:sugar phosphate isomerase/epimerase
MDRPDLAVSTDFAEDTDLLGRTVSTVAGRLKMAAAAGFTAVHWCEDWNNTRVYSPADMDAIAATIAGEGLRCIDVHAAATREVNVYSEDAATREQAAALLRNRADLCARLGADALVLHVPDDDATAAGKMRAALPVLEPVVAHCRSRGVRLAAENPLRESIAVFFERFPPEEAGLCFDSGHANRRGEHDLVEIWGPRLAALHLHDNKGDRDAHDLPFNGTVPWERVMKAIRASGYAKPICLEVMRGTCRNRLAPDEFAREAYRRAVRLREMMGGDRNSQPHQT